ncbi:MAG: hypothetical protein IPK99_13085 [Flavobacteriales bacterium]|nr:hypothetical protein [Flavobacteriales bacterium]
MNGTPNNYGYYLLADGASLDTAALAKGFHFKQLQWARSEPTEFHVLEQPFGPGVTPAQAGWYGSGEQYEGSFVLRSTMGDRPAIAAFQIVFNIPAGRIWVAPYGSVPVRARFGDPASVTPPAPIDKPPSVRFYPDHELEPQVVIPAGLPPDEPVDLNFDEVPDAIITGHEEHSHGTGRMGYYVRVACPLRPARPSSCSEPTACRNSGSVKSKRSPRTIVGRPPERHALLVGTGTGQGLLRGPPSSLRHAR